MKFNRTTKSALFTSVVSLFLCFAMLLGTTFAWFTDSATSAGNKIVAGTLDVQLLMWDGAKYVDISKDKDPIFGNEDSLVAQNNNLNTLWEPGKTQVAYLAIKNVGSLDLKYEVAINVVNPADGKNLYEVMEYAIVPDAKDGAAVPAWTDGTPVVLGNNVATTADVTLEKDGTHYFALAVHMNEEAGNEYQGGSVEFDVTVLAAQVNTESDSFGSDYDKYAPFGTQGKAPVVAGQPAPVEVRDRENKYKVASFDFPAAAIADDATEIVVDVNEGVYEGNFTIAAGLEKLVFDVKVTGLKEGNTTPIKSMLKIPAGIDPATVVAYHYDDSIDDATYNPETGYVTFYTTGYSPFTIVYDADSVYIPPVADDSELPKATVVKSTEYENVDLPWGSYGQWSPTAGLDSKLEAAYTFSCTETLEEAKENPYANWHCDFYVVLDKDLGANEIFLGGNYGSFGWVGFHNGDLTLDANTEIGLLESVTTNPWTYLDVVQNVGTFICGVGEVDDALADKDATFTVMLRLTNPDDATDFVNVATITHKFVK